LSSARSQVASFSRAQMLTAQSLLFIISSLCLSWSLSIPKRDGAPLRSLSIEEIASFKPYTLFASTAYCSPPIVNAWSCGEKCNLNTGFTPVASGGDGVDVQYCKYLWTTHPSPRSKRRLYQGMLAIRRHYRRSSSPTKEQT
jgi:hypothetical protein